MAQGRTVAAPTSGRRTAGATEPRERAVGERRLDVAVLTVIAALGAVHLAFPFTGDQALFAIAARELRHGAVLYRDFWDVKQPAVFLFYLAAGVVGGFNAVAVHALELAVLLVFAAWLQRCARRFVTRAWVASVLPLFVVGFFYATARPIELTQVEALIGVPLFASVWLAMRTLDSTRHRALRLVGAGLAAGVAASLKLVCAPLVLPAWLVVVVTLARRDPRRTRAAFSASGWLLLGLAVPLGAMAAYFAAHGLTGEVIRTYFVYTPKTTSIAGRPLSRLLDSVTRFTVLGAPLLLLAAGGVVATVRRGWDGWASAFAGWAVLGVLVFLGQHWWAYQTAMFLVPVGFFAARGLDAFATAAPQLRARSVATVVLVLAIAALPVAVSCGRAIVTAGRDGFGVTRTGRVALADAEQSQYRTARAFARFVRAHDPGDGPVYVLGNPIDLYVTGRDQAIPTNGWAAEQYDATAWHRIADGLRRTRPRVLAVDDFSARYVNERSPATRDVIAQLYCPVRHVAGETWYVLRAGSGSACPASNRLSPRRSSP